MGWIRTDYGNGWTPPPIQQIYTKGVATTSFNGKTLTVLFNGQRFKSIYLKDPDLGWSASIISLKATVVDPNGVEKIYQYSVGNDSFDIELSCAGEYKITFTLKYSVDTTLLFISSWLAFFAVNPEQKLLPNTIKNVIHRVLSVTPTRTVNGSNKYTFRNNAEDYSTEESPEFTFTGKHLFEVMLDIASYKKMFPALYKDEIYFRPFWNGEMLTSDDLPPPTKAVLCSAIDQYCTALDSYVENMVCINDTRVGTVVEPYKGGYISGRSNSGAEISETTTVIPTQSPIYQSIAVEVGETNGYTVGDIQSYVYEQEDYDSLSDTSAAYPYSKNYALKFTRFEKNYTELAHRIKTSSTISAAFTKPALANIIDKATNGAVGDAGVSLLDWLSGFIDKLTDSNGEKKDDAAPFADLLFQTTYIPVVNARVRQYKPMFSEEDYEATLFYNQQSEVVDSEAFGEHVKGLVQKLGNHTEIRVYCFEKIDDVPTVGTLIDEKSVYNVAMTIYENHVDVTLCLVDYAELSTYIGVKNEIKTSDISATKWCNRFINWEEYLVFSHEPYLGTTALSITKETLRDIVSFTTSDQELTCAMFTSYAEGDIPITTAFAPIKHLAIGNSIYFQWEMLDNFAVGYKSEKAPENATDAWTGTLYDRAQEAVRYCDSYGRMETLDFKLLKAGPSVETPIDIPMTWTVTDEVLTVEFYQTFEFYCVLTIRYTFANDSTERVWSAPTDGSQKTIQQNIGDWNIIDVKVEPAISENVYKEAYKRFFAHSYPQMPEGLRFTPTPAFELNDLLIKKDSAEALKFAAQYHFRQDWSDFIIGSGMSNFCSLVGGYCFGLKLFISKRPINRFERHVNLGDTYNYLVLDELPSFNIDEENLRVEITLPESVNDYSDRVKSWGLVGVDRNGNRQLIFGENKNSKNENFKTTIYLVPRQKNNEPKSRATYTLYRATSNTSRGCAIYVDGVIVSGTGYEETLEITRRAKVTIENTAGSSVNLSLSKIKVLIDGTREIISSEQVNIGYRGSYTFAMNLDMVFDVWTTAINPSDPMPM